MGDGNGRSCPRKPGGLTVAPAPQPRGSEGETSLWSGAGLAGAWLERNTGKSVVSLAFAVRSHKKKTPNSSNLHMQIH